MLKFGTVLDIKSQLLQGINEMNFKAKFKRFLVIVSVSSGLLMATPAMSDALTINIDGCFSANAAGAECGNSLTDIKAYASGSFELWDTLGVSAPNTLQTLAGKDLSYVASTSISAEAVNDPSVTFNDEPSKFFSTLNDLITDPQWPAALGVFQAVVAGGPLAGINFVTSGVTTMNTATGVHIDGMFMASSSDLGGLDLFSNSLFQRDLPRIPVNFTAGASLVAVAEPASLALIGLGIFAMRFSLRRNKKSKL